MNCFFGGTSRYYRYLDPHIVSHFGCLRLKGYSQVAHNCTWIGNKNGRIEHNLAESGAVRLQPQTVKHNPFSASPLTWNVGVRNSRRSQALPLYKHNKYNQRRTFTTTSTKAKSAVIAFGSNLGDRVGHIEGALDALSRDGIKVLKLSKLYETKPMYVEDQASFLNGVALVETELDPIPLLDTLQKIELEAHRVKVIDKGPRTLDLDIVLYDNERVAHERLTVPHRLMLEREFVLRPLAE